MLGYQRAAVVHSGGMDEVSLHAPTVVAELHNGEIKSYQLTADDFGLTPYHQAQLAGGTPEENRDILTRLLQGKGEAAHEAAVAANVAMLMRLHGHEDLKANAQQVLDVLHSGAAYDRVDRLSGKRVKNADRFSKNRCRQSDLGRSPQTTTTVSQFSE